MMSFLLMFIKRFAVIERILFISPASILSMMINCFCFSLIVRLAICCSEARTSLVLPHFDQILLNQCRTFQFLKKHKIPLFDLIKDDQKVQIFQMATSMFIPGRRPTVPLNRLLVDFPLTRKRWETYE